jgi:hypothetical protein
MQVVVVRKKSKPSQRGNIDERRARTLPSCLFRPVTVVDSEKPEEFEAEKKSPASRPMEFADWALQVQKSTWAGEVPGKDRERVSEVKTRRHVQCRANSRREFPGSKSAWRRG